MKGNIFKSIGVIILAFMINALLSITTDFLLESIGILPKPENGLFETWAILLVLFYRAAYTILTGFIIAKLAPVKPMLHAMILGTIALIITLPAVSNPSFAEKSEMWFGYALLALIFAYLWLGVMVHRNWRSSVV